MLKAQRPCLYPKGASTLGVEFTMQIEHLQKNLVNSTVGIGKQQQIVGNQKSDFTLVNYFKQLTSR